MNAIPRIFRRSCLCLVAVVFCLTTWAGSAGATVKLDGVLTAQQPCKALQSIRKGTNPGNITLIPEQTYPVIGKNRSEASHYLVRVAEASPPTRWVAVDCGEVTSISGDTIAPAPGSRSKQAEANVEHSYLLALSWEPSFCEYRPEKLECLTQTEVRFDASHLVLHGLWPQPRSNVYCDQPKEIITLDKQRRWSEMPDLDLSDETRAVLAIEMPGITSSLQKHEWYKHGTCYSETPEEYFQESLMLLDQINSSKIQALFAANIDQLLTANEIQDLFDEEFGEGSGARVKLRCNDDEDRTLIGEVWINLQGEIDLKTQIADLLREAPLASAGCSVGEVDGVDPS